MAEQGWDDGSEAPPTKRGIPGWLWFCGGGCLIAAVLGIVLAVFAWKQISQGTIAEEQWPKLAAVLPFDQRPPHLVMRMGWHLFVTVYYLDDDRGFTMLVYDLEADKAEGFRKIFEPDFDGGGGTFGFGGVEDAELAQLELQGRTVPVQRFYQSGGSGGGEAGGPGVQHGQSVFVDVTPADHPGLVPVLIVRTRSGRDRISDDEIRDILSYFKIGPEYVPPPPVLPEEEFPAREDDEEEE